MATIPSFMKYKKNYIITRAFFMYFINEGMVAIFLKNGFWVFLNPNSGFGGPKYKFYWTKKNLYDKE